MPAVSKAQQALFAIAEHDPGKLRGKNKKLTKLGKAKLHEFAATKTSKLPAHKSKGYGEPLFQGGGGRR